MSLVSLCLLGCPCRYDGQSRPREEVLARLSNEPMIPVCPENLAGMPTPRPKVYIERGTGEDVLDHTSRVLRDDGHDVTADVLRAVQGICRQAEVFGVERAYLAERSPSCGVEVTAGPDGARPGPGVLAAALRRAGIEVIGVGSGEPRA